MKYPVSVWLDYFYDLPFDKAIARLAKAGFTHGELSLTHLKELMAMGNPTAAGKRLRQAADSCGYAIPQGHLSFIGGLCDDSAMERLMPELDMFAAAGIGKAILHTNGGKELSDEARYDRWVHYVRKLSEYVEGTGVTLCVENMFSIPQCSTVQQIKSIIDDAGGRNLAICLDTGHLHLSRINHLTEQTHREFILGAGELLQALHITENNGVKDTHQMPFSARYGIDWKEVITALDEIGYKDLFNLEILGERIAPLPIRDAKLSFALAMCGYMLSEDFLTDPYVYPSYDVR
ncbi:MAG: sugar phosphate isomerase/epimerase [Ruminococcaceae bacterium]|nr:sugar phosphate isomerase/epimerase [Oscillospiraceae bacterium]